jgi:hypothetical protein
LVSEGQLAWLIGASYKPGQVILSLFSSDVLEPIEWTDRNFQPYCLTTKGQHGERVTKLDLFTAEKGYMISESGAGIRGMFSATTTRGVFDSFLVLRPRKLTSEEALSFAEVFKAINRAINVPRYRVAFRRFGMFAQASWPDCLIDAYIAFNALFPKLEGRGLDTAIAKRVSNSDNEILQTQEFLEKTRQLRNTVIHAETEKEVDCYVRATQNAFGRDDELKLALFRDSRDRDLPPTAIIDLLAEYLCKILYETLSVREN